MIGMCGLDALGHVDGVAHVRVAPSYVAWPGAEHPGDDLEVVAEGVHPLTDGREAVAVGQPLVLLPAGADAELEAAAADDVERRGELGGQRRVAEAGADDHVAEPDTRGHHGQRGERRERLEGDLVGRLGHRVEVVEDPQRLEAERLGLRGELDGPRPGLGGVPAVVLALPALGHHQTDLHPVPCPTTPPRPAGRAPSNTNGAEPARRARPIAQQNKRGDVPLNGAVLPAPMSQSEPNSPR